MAYGILWVIRILLNHKYEKMARRNNVNTRTSLIQKSIQLDIQLLPFGPLRNLMSKWEKDCLELPVVVISYNLI